MIVKVFQIPLTKKQSDMIRAKWSKFGTEAGMMLVLQPKCTWGPFALKYSFLNCAVVSRGTATKLAKVMDHAKKQSQP